MTRISRIALALLAATELVHGQIQFGDMPQCGQNCFSDVIGRGNRLGCPSESPSCLCANPDFGFGVRDCALQACGPDIAASVTNFATALCATATLATATVPSPAETTPPAEPSSTPPPSPAPEPTPTPSSTPPPPPPPPAAVPTSSSTSHSASSPATATPPSPTTSTPALSTGVASGSSPQQSKEQDDGGLTVGAKAGVGIAAGVGAAVIIALAVCFFGRRRNRRSALAGGSGGNGGRSMYISDPLPGSGRSYAPGDDPEVGGGRGYAGGAHKVPAAASAYHFGLAKGSPPGSADGTTASNGTLAPMSELEMRSRRYEDMVPRAKPVPYV